MMNDELLFTYYNSRPMQQECVLPVISRQMIASF